MSLVHQCSFKSSSHHHSSASEQDHRAHLQSESEPLPFEGRPLRNFPKHDYGTWSKKFFKVRTDPFPEIEGGFQKVQDVSE